MRHWPAVRVRGSVATTVLLALAVLFGAPTALAAKPVRTVISPNGFVAPPGVLCSFGVQIQPDPTARVAITEFADGRVQFITHADVTLTNLTTGASISTRSRYHDNDTYDVATNDVVFDLDGRSNWFLVAGDQGPFGVTGEDGAMFTIVGHVIATVDLDTDTLTSFSWNGQYTDLCALLAA